MEPFAVQQPGRPRWPWLVVGLTAAAFGVWQFDIVPRIRTGSAGTVRGTGDPSGDDVPPLADALDRITDVDVGQLKTDPAVPGDDKNLPRHDRRVRQASYEQSVGNGGTDVDELTGSDADLERADGNAVESADSETPPLIPAALAQQLRQIDQFIRDDQILEAHEELSRIYWKRPEFRSLVGARIAQTASQIYSSPERHFGKPFDVQAGDTLDSIATQHKLTWQYLAQLNRVTPEKLKAGQQLKVVQGPFSAVIDLQQYTLTVHAHGWYIHHYTIGIGRDETTPVGEFRVLNKLENPVWYNPEGGIVSADDPTNPLGEYWLGLGSHIGIHGTIAPDSIGRSVSRGCIHLADSDIQEVYHLLSTDSPVVIRSSAGVRK